MTAPTLLVQRGWWLGEGIDDEARRRLKLRGLHNGALLGERYAVIADRKARALARGDVLELARMMLLNYGAGWEEKHIACVLRFVVLAHEAPVYGRDGHAEFMRDVADRAAALAQLDGTSDVELAARSSQLRASSPSGRQAGPSSLDEDLALEFSKGAYQL